MRREGADEEALRGEAEAAGPIETADAAGASAGDVAPGEGDKAGEAVAERVPWWRGIGEFVVAFAIMAGAILAIRTFVIEPFEIPSGSMLNTIQIGDRVFSEKISVLFDRMPDQGEIVTFKSLTSDETLIKRVIATEGQTVDLRDGVVYVDGVALDEPYTEGKESNAMAGYNRSVYPTNNAGIAFPYTVPDDFRIESSSGAVVATAGQVLDKEGSTVTVDGEPVSAAGTLYLTRDDITYPYTVPEGCFWAMGDNRTNSSDSRAFGAVPAANVTGRAVMRYWPVFRLLPEVEVDLGWFSFTAHPLEVAIGPLD